jgi:hypothetical protein
MSTREAAQAQADVKANPLGSVDVMLDTSIIVSMRLSCSLGSG